MNVVSIKRIGNGDIVVFTLSKEDEETLEGIKNDMCAVGEVFPECNLDYDSSNDVITITAKNRKKFGVRRDQVPIVVSLMRWLKRLEIL